jgi:hypothetical protein
VLVIICQVKCLVRVYTIAVIVNSDKKIHISFMLTKINKSLEYQLTN